MRLWPVILTFLLAIGADAARAHPHVFVDYTVEYRVKDNAIVGLRLIWLFDDQYSALVIDTADRDRNGKFSPEEIAVLAKRVVSSLEKNRLYSDVTYDGVKWQPDHVSEFSAAIVDDRLVYSFVVDLPKPAREVTVSTYDAEYYIEMLAQRKHAFDVVGAPAATLQCSLGFASKVATQSYGSFQPDAVTCSIKAQ